MNEAVGLIEANWLVFAAAALLVLLVTWWLLSRSAKSNRRREYQPDVLDKGVGPAQRNQALIDAAPAAQVVMPPMASNALGGLGEIVAIAAQDEVEEARVAEIAPPPPPPPPPPPLPEPVQRPVTEVLAEPVEIPGLDEAASPERTEREIQQPDAAFDVAPEPEPIPAPAATPQTADDLARIKGLGPKLQTLLPTLGITTFAQIAALTEADLAALDPQLGPFAGRPVRDGWVEQAQYLAAGDTAGFEARFGKV